MILLLLLFFSAAIHLVYPACTNLNFNGDVILSCVEYPLTTYNKSLIRISVRNLVDYSLSYDDIDPLSGNPMTVDVYSTPKQIPEFIIHQDPSSSEYVNKLIGVALDGVPIYTGTVSLHEDAVALSVNGDSASDKVLKIDGCGGCYGDTPDGYRYHYRVMPTCIFDSTSSSVIKRKQYVDDIFQLLDQYADMNVSNSIIGYSLYGYPIYTPYTSRGLLHDKLDNCNGKFIDGTYGYYVTPNFPYVIGCDGPGTYNTYDEQVTLEGMQQKVSSKLYDSCPMGSYPSQSKTGCVRCPAGKYASVAYSSPSVKSIGRSIQSTLCNMDCPVGHYCLAGSTSALHCPAGRFGSSIGLTNSDCTGQCQAGYFCPAGSIKSNQYSCGNATYYCPSSTGVRIKVDDSFYSIPSEGESLRVGQAVCPYGSYCKNGIKLPCPSGTYGETTGLNNSSCTALCPIGSYCPLGSVNPIACPAGKYGDDLGLKSEACSGLCSPGHYCDQGSVSSTQTKCQPGIYGKDYGLISKECSSLCEMGGGPNVTSSSGTKYCYRQYCEAGYYCKAGSTSPTQSKCGNANVYCAAGSSQPSVVDEGYYSVGPVSAPGQMQSVVDIEVRTGQVLCEIGFYCLAGVRIPNSSA